VVDGRAKEYRTVGTLTQWFLKMVPLFHFIILYDVTGKRFKPEVAFLNVLGYKNDWRGHFDLAVIIQVTLPKLEPKLSDRYFLKILL
jgi:hypothetical protein